MFIAYYPKHSRHLKTPRGIPQFCFCIGNVPLPTLLPTEWSGRIEAHGGIDYTVLQLHVNAIHLKHLLWPTYIYLRDRKSQAIAGWDQRVHTGCNCNLTPLAQDKRMKPYRKPPKWLKHILQLLRRSPHKWNVLLLRAKDVKQQWATLFWLELSLRCH